MTELTRKHYLLKKTLDELEIVPDWHTVDKRVVNSVLRDMASAYLECGMGINFGYDHKFSAISENLNGDLEIISNLQRDEIFEKELNSAIREKVLEYKQTDSFEKILRDVKADKLAKERDGDFEELEFSDLVKMMDPYKN